MDCQVLQEIWLNNTSGSDPPCPGIGKTTVACGPLIDQKWWLLKLVLAIDIGSEKAALSF